MAKPGYLETEEKLKVRILAHTKYTTLRLEEWLRDWLGDARGCRLLEIGCGDGNFFPTYAQVLGRDGMILGLDINVGLLERARAVGTRLGTPALVFVWDFDRHPFPLLSGEVDFVVSPFSAYYAQDVSAWVEDSLRVLKAGGRLLLLGPTADNAQELYELNQLATGVRTVTDIDETMVRLEGAFYPELQRATDGRVRKSVLNRELAFPSPEEFARYYFATWLYEKTREKVGAPIEYEAVVKAAGRTSLRLNKRVVCLEAWK